MARGRIEIGCARRRRRQLIRCQLILSRIVAVELGTDAHGLVVAGDEVSGRAHDGTGNIAPEALIRGILLGLAPRCRLLIACVWLLSSDAMRSAYEP